ncbi:MAG: hypothetical protein DRO23_07745 [Thermoprotei archaeon]|nr:MAG: hypothetical protein DRO23_07745 [Thermoprotei archaeon]
MLLRNSIKLLSRFLNTRNIRYLLALIVNVPLILFRVYEISYDAYTHMFFAKHYMENWFSLWETKWYGGFWVTSYPPLLHQLIAALAKIIGLEYAFGVVLFASIILLLYAAIFFSENVLEIKSKLSSILIIFTPSIYLFAYCFGQLPTILAFSFTLLSATYFRKALITKSKISFLNLLQASLFASLTIMTHHVTTVFLLPTLISVITLDHLIRLGLRRKKAVLKAVATLGAYLVVALTIASPIVYHMIVFFTKAPVQAPIPHASRENIFENIVSSATFFWGVYGPLVFLIPVAFFTLADMKKYVFLVFILGLFIFGLGGVTPIPRIMLGDRLYDVLTFDKFSFWTSIFMVPLISYYLEHKLKELVDNTSLTVKVLMASLIVSLILTILLPRIVPLQPQRPNIDAIAEYLNDQEGLGFYITLGLGTWSQELSLKITKPTLDGGYNTARTLPILVHSGVESIDAAKAFPNGTFLINAILDQAEEYGIRWVIVGDKTLETVVAEKGFRKVHEVDWVTIWEQENYVKGFLRTYRVYDRRDLLWGIVPLTILSLTAILNIWYRLWRRK